MTSFNQAKTAAYDNVARQQYFRANFAGLSAHERHLKFLNDYDRFYGGDSSQARSLHNKLEGTDLSALKEGHRFIRSTEDDAEESWGAKLANRYYQRLFKEYCIADLSRYKESKLGLRWRTEKEVVVGKGQFICGAKGCEEKAGLCSYEVNFAYVEAGQQKQALVKLRVCPACAYKLNYKKEKEYQKAAAKRESTRPGKRAHEQDMGTGAKQLNNKRANLIAAEELLMRVAEGGSVDTIPQRESVVPPPGRLSHPAASDVQLAGQPQVSVLPGDDSIWEQKQAQEVATAEEDFDQYFEGLFV